MRHALQAAAVALDGIRGFSDQEREAIVGVLRTARVRARPGDEGWASSLPALADRGFAWGEFDRWHAFFSARGAFPGRWDGLQTVPTSQAAPETRVAYRRRKLGLLLEWLDMLTRRTAELHHYTRQGRQVRIVRQDDRHPCPVCDPARPHGARDERDAMPPLHPGCRCVLMAAMTATRQRPSVKRRDRPA